MDEDSSKKNKKWLDRFYSPLLKDSICQRIEIKSYDPFQSPPDRKIVENHVKSRLVGIPQENSDYCPCCNNYIDKDPIPIFCSEQELSFLGSGIPLYFSLTKKFGILIFIIFMITGSYQFFLHNMACKRNCITFLMVPVLNLDYIENHVYSSTYENISVSIIIIGLLFLIKPLIYNDIESYEEGFVSASRYTILVQNIPKKLTKDEIAAFFNGLTGEKIVKINMCYEIERYKSYFERKIQLSKELNELELARLKDPQDLIVHQEIRNLKSEIEICNINLEEFKTTDHKNFIGTAFVSFQKQEPAKSLIKKYGFTSFRQFIYILFGKWLYVCLYFINFKNQYFSSKQNPYLKYNDFETLIIRSAPPPSDCLWENMGYSKNREIMNNTVMVFVSLFILFFSFQLQYLMMKVVYPYKKEMKEHSIFKADDIYVTARAIGMSLVVMIVNAVLRIVVYRNTAILKMESRTSEYEDLKRNKQISFMPYIVHSKFDSQSEATKLLIVDIHFILLASAFSTPIIKIIDFGRIQAWFRVWYMNRYNLKENPYTQHEANMISEKKVINIADSYSYISRTLFLCTWYASVAPLGVLLSLVGILFNYWVDKIQLLRYQSTPEAVSSKIISTVISSLELLPFIYICGNIEYELRISISDNVFEFISSFIYYGAATSTSLIIVFICYFWFSKLERKMRRQQNNYWDKTYQEVRYKFRTEYDQCNPITQFRSRIEWIQFLHQKKLIGLKQQQDLLNMHKTCQLSPFIKSNLQAQETNSTLMRKQSSKQFIELEVIVSKFASEDENKQSTENQQQII